MHSQCHRINRTVAEILHWRENHCHVGTGDKVQEILTGIKFSGGLS